MVSVVFGLLFSFLSSLALSAPPESVSLLEKGLFLEARDEIRTELASEESGTGYLNLGISELKLGESVEAYVHFLRASEFLPRSSEVAFFIRQAAQNQTWKKFEDRSFLGVFFFPGMFFNEYELWLTAALALFLSSLMLCLMIFYQKKVSLALMPLLFSLYTLGAALQGSLQSDTWIVTRKDTVLNSTPSNSPQPLETLTKLSVLRLVKESNGWAYGQISSGKKGWIHESDFLKAD